MFAFLSKRNSYKMNYNENQELFEKAAQGDENAIEELMANNLDLVRTIALKFRDRGIEYDDLVGIGSIGMLKAIRSFDFSSGISFSTYAVPLIVGEIYRFIRDDVSNEEMKNLLQLKKTVFDLGLKKEYKFFQISDMHLACFDENSTEEDKNEYTRCVEGWKSLKYDFARDCGEFCDERYDIEPQMLFEKMVSYVATQKADALILSGDIFDRVTDSNIRFLDVFIKNCPLPVIYCPGNHDWINEAGAHNVYQYHRIMPVIKNPDCDSYDFGEFEIVTIDNGTKNITDKQIAFLKGKLNGDKKILLVVHAPLYLGESGEEIRSKMSPYFLMGVEGDSENAHLFNQLVKENDQKIIAVLTGHIHAFHEGYVTENLKQYSTSSGLIGSMREIIIK